MLTLANTVKPNKREAFNIVKAGLEGNDITDKDMQSLFLYFAPPMPRKAKTVEQWCAQAVADKNHIRVQLQRLYANNGELVATNGHLMKWSKTDLENGYYCPKTLAKVDCDLKYAGYERITDKAASLDEHLTEIEISSMELYENGKTWKYRHPELGIFQKEYLDKVAENGVITVAVTPDRSPLDVLYGTHEFGRFALMPMRD